MCEGSDVSVERSLFSGFVYLSSLSAEQAASAADDLKGRLEYIPESLQAWFKQYLDHYSVYDCFPDVSAVAEAFGQTDVPPPDEAARLFSRQMAIWESDALSRAMPGQDMLARRKSLERLQSLLAPQVSDTVDLVSVKDKDWSSAFVKTADDAKDGVLFPVKRVMSQVIFNPGMQLAIFGSPASGKTALALNFTYLNIFQRAYNVLYVYLENVEVNYMAELLSHHSYVRGDRMENRSLKAKVLPTEEGAVRKINSLVADFKAGMKGSVRFVPFSDMLPRSQGSVQTMVDPARYGATLARVCDKYSIDIVILDYAQRAAQFNGSARMDRNTFVDMLVSSQASAALGAYGNRPFVSVVLSQLNREAMRKMDKTQSISFTAFDGAGSSSLERDSFAVVGIYSNPQMRSENRCAVKTLKARDGEADIEEDNQVPYYAEYCCLGDNSGAKVDPDQYSMDAMRSLPGGAFDSDLLDL